MGKLTLETELRAWETRLAYRRHNRNRLLREVEASKRRNMHLIRALASAQIAVEHALAETDRIDRQLRPTLVMYDSVDVDAIPADCEAWAGYVAGNDWSDNAAALRTRFPGARSITITATSDALADMLDVELGAASPRAVVEWIHNMWRHDHAWVGVYASAAKWPAINAKLDGLHLGFPGREPIRRWVADWDGIAEIPPGYWGKQYKTGTYDTSIVRADFPF